MHIEPGVVNGAKLVLGYATAAGSIAFAGKLCYESAKRDGVAALGLRAIVTTLLVLSFFQVLPHHPVGVSEVHLILGSTLFLMFGAGAAAIGLVVGLLAQGLLFAPTDLPQFGMNVTSLLVPLFAVRALAARLVPETVAYKDVTYKQTLALSTAYQGGVVAWVAFWALYGQGFGAETLAQVAAFGAAYTVVIVIEPLVALATLAAAKGVAWLESSRAIDPRVYRTTA